MFASRRVSFLCLSGACHAPVLALGDALTLAAIESTVAAPPPAEKLDAATIAAPRTVPAGARFEASWTGPDNPGDYITVVPAGAPAAIRVLIEPGACGIRDVSGQGRRGLARPALLTTAPVR